MKKLLLFLIVFSVFFVKVAKAYTISGCTAITSPGEYYLTQDIINAPIYGTSACIDIQANNVLLDCQNRLVDGRDDGIGIKVMRTSYQTVNVVIRNCRVSDFYYGIRVEASRNVSILNCEMSSNYWYQIYFDDEAHNGTVANTRVINGHYYGIGYFWSNYGNFTNNTISNNGFVGVYFDDSSYNFFYNNTVANHPEEGIRAYTDNSIFTFNRIFGNSEEGIYVSGNNNRIFNNFFNNSINVGVSGTNFWNTTRQPGTRIYTNGTEIGGNFWATPAGNGFSQTCNDSNQDGFCDTAYVISSGNVDYLPYSLYYAPPPPPPPPPPYCMLINQSGTYYLTQDIINNNSDRCIIINASNVVFDCQNRLIDGIDKEFSDGIAVIGSSIVIRNCRLSDWDSAISLLEGSNITVENVSIQSSYTGFSVFASNVKIKNFYGENLYIGYSSQYSERNEIEGCELKYGTEYSSVGFFPFLSPYFSLKNCIISGFYIGIRIDSGCDNSTIKNVTLFNNTFGIWISSMNVTLTNSYIYNNSYGFGLGGIDYYASANIYNNLFNNTINHIISPQSYPTNYYIPELASKFNTTYSPGPNIIGGAYLGGNVYSTPTNDGFSDICDDNNNDGICDEECLKNFTINGTWVFMGGIYVGYDNTTNRTYYMNCVNLYTKNITNDTCEYVDYCPTPYVLYTYLDEYFWIDYLPLKSMVVSECVRSEPYAVIYPTIRIEYRLNLTNYTLLIKNMNSPACSPSVFYIENIECPGNCVICTEIYCHPPAFPWIDTTPLEPGEERIYVINVTPTVSGLHNISYKVYDSSTWMYTTATAKIDVLPIPCSPRPPSVAWTGWYMLRPKNITRLWYPNEGLAEIYNNDYGDTCVPRNFTIIQNCEQNLDCNPKILNVTIEQYQRKDVWLSATPNEVKNYTMRFIVRDPLTGYNTTLTWNFTTSDCAYITKPVTYYLNRDVIFKEGECFTVFSSNVVIDCKNHTIVGPTWASGITIHNDVSNVEVRNCKLVNYSIGIRSGDNNNVRLKNIQLIGYNMSDIETMGLYSTSNNLTVDNLLIENYYRGIYATGLNSSEIKNSIIRGTGTAIHLDYLSKYNRIANNRLINNTYGIRIWEGSRDNIIENNTISHHYIAIEVWHIRWLLIYSGNIIANNTIYNTSQALYLRRTTGNMIYGNYFFTLYPYPVLIDTSNIWNSSKTGNFWGSVSGVDGYSEKCMDSNMDGFCDQPYVLSENNIDYLPLSKFGKIAFPPPPVEVKYVAPCQICDPKGMGIYAIICFIVNLIFCYPFLILIFLAIFGFYELFKRLRGE